ncbi:MAG: right-handed parallel beta-helix repeat-containing protein [Candidatus Hydrogenedentes bacterium]|nr:right-handed parallel beta-helix repeat-containing protein [Candidatus Hydrogenedentota bacterium]
MKRLFLGCAWVAALQPSALGAVWYVDKDHTAGTETGASWSAAFNTIQEGIDAAFDASGGEVWVAEGVYDELRASAEVYNTGSVLMREGVHLYGGFAGVETVRTQRDWTTHITTIDGSTSRNGEAAYHVVVGANDATLDGFTITGGNADSFLGGGGGGGMHNSSVSPTVANCTFTGNSAEAFSGGGAMYNEFSSPMVTHCVFTENSGDFGGAMLNSSSSPMVIASTFTANSANAGGGAMYNVSSSPIVTNCTFTLNTVSGDSFDGNYGGGAMYNSSSSPTVTNCTFTDNSDGYEGYGGGLYNYSSSPRVANCILWNNVPDEISSSGAGSPVVTFSDIKLQGTATYPGTGNINADPLSLFVAFGDHRLAGNSPCVDVGTVVGAPVADTLGTPRPQGNGVDMGAYEYPSGSPDTDGDFIPDEWEGNADLDGDGIPNSADTDSDGDGLPDAEELFYGCSPYNPDMDGDGILDGPEVDNLLNPLDAGDAVLDQDNDGLSARDEVNVHGINPFDNDTDNDGMPDGWEANYSLDPLANDATSDADGDAVSNLSEYQRGMNPRSTDTDGDGMPDGWEVANSLDPLINDGQWDADGDGVNNISEYQRDTNPQNTDSDSDGMPDGWEVQNSLDPLVDDAATNSDGDLFSNLGEYLRGTDPNNAADPPDDVYVSNTGNDQTGDGTEGNPWLTIAYAMADVSRHATDFHPVTTHLFAGTYQERVVFVPHVRLVGADADDPAATVIRWFGGSDDNVVVTAADDTALEDVRVTLPPAPISSDVVLVRIDNVGIEVANVVLDGGFKQLSTAVLAAGLGSSASTLRDSQVVRVNDGVWATDSAMKIARNEFNQILNNAVFILLPKQGEGDTPQIGDVTQVETTGFNRFREIANKCLFNGSDATTVAEMNDWGVYTEEAIAGKVYGPVDYVPFIGKIVLPGSLAINVLNAESSIQIGADASPEVWIPVLSLGGQRDPFSGVFFFDGIDAGNWTAEAGATGYESAVRSVDVFAGRITVANIMLAPPPRGPTDIDGNNAVNAVDVQLVINAALGLNTGYNCDVDNSGNVDAVDVQKVINGALGLSSRMNNSNHKLHVSPIRTTSY